MGKTTDYTEGAQIVDQLPLEGFNLDCSIVFERDDRDRVAKLIGKENVKWIETFRFLGLHIFKGKPFPLFSRRGIGPIFMLPNAMPVPNKVTWNGMKKEIRSNRKKARDLVAFVEGLEDQVRAKMVVELMPETTATETKEAQKAYRETGNRLAELISEIERLGDALERTALSEGFGKRGQPRNEAAQFVANHLHDLWRKTWDESPSQNTPNFMELMRLAMVPINGGIGLEGPVRKRYEYRLAKDSLAGGVFGQKDE